MTHAAAWSDSDLPRPRTPIAELAGARELIGNLVLRELRSKYRRTVLGHAWSLINPIAQIAIFSFVFAYLLRIRAGQSVNSDLDVFALWLSAGLLPWIYFSTTVNTGLSVLVGNANLIKKVYFPRAALLVANSLALLVTFAIEMVVLHIAIVAFGGRPLVYLPATVFLMALLCMFALGVSFVLAIANVYFRDTQHLVGLLMLAWFYGTPIIYSIELVAERDGLSPTVVDLYELNPMARFVAAFRDTLYDARWPPLGDLAYLVGVSVVVVAVGFVVFLRYERRLAEEL